MEQSFAYRARDANGQEKRGQRPGASALAVAQELVRLGMTPLEVKAAGGSAAMARAAAVAAPSGAAGSSGSDAPKDTHNAEGTGSATATGSRWRWHQRITAKTETAFGMALRELSALLKAGVPLMRALTLASETGTDEQVRTALKRIAGDLDSGLALTEAAQNERQRTGLISAYDVAMLQVGEKTGRLPECFADMHRHREFQNRTQQQVGSALRYPMFVVLTCLIALVVVNIWVIPSFAKVFAATRSELPMLTQFLLNTSKLMLKTWPVLLVGTVLAVVGWTRWTSTPAGRLRWDRMKLKLPIVGGILMDIQMSRLSAALASSIAAGLTISDSLVVAGRTLGNRWVESRVQQMCADLARGTSIAYAARNMGVLPNTMLQMFAIGEESGSLEALMREISQHYQAEVDHAIGKLSETIEPLMIWIMGGGVLVLALGIFMPMWDLGSATLK
ncbi:MAG: type II secretion system F family protein [Rubrivivax sp.]|jgi:MSHA biogenesis protein MshG